MSNAFEKLIDFVNYVEEKARESKYGFDPKETALLRADFDMLKALAELDMRNFEIHDLIFLEGQFDTIMAEAESRYKHHKAEVECRWLKYLLAILVSSGIIGAILRYLG